MSSSINVTEVFERFKGKEIRAINKSMTSRGETYDNILIDETDPTVIELRAAFNHPAVTLSLGLPGQFTTPRVNLSRINIKLEPTADPLKFRIPDKFTRG